jgi:hypothetical protein
VRMLALAMIALIGMGAAVAVGIPGLAQSPPPSQTQDQTQDPQYACSIKVPENSTQDLKQLAKITPAQAQAAAEKAVSGTVLRNKLENENGCVVYSVEIRSADAKVHDIKVDAGNAAVVHQEVGTGSGTENEGPGDNENGKED